MTLSQQDLLWLMEALRTADGVELIRVLAQRIPQELI
jgi:putative transposase